MACSGAKEMCLMYEDVVKQYSEMMNGEINLPTYAATLGLGGHISAAGFAPSCPIVDTSCGPGHMLKIDASRALAGVDITSKMVALCLERLSKLNIENSSENASAGEGEGEANCRVTQGDMCELADAPSDSCCVVISFTHCSTSAQRPPRRLSFSGMAVWLHPGGQLVAVASEGSGPIDRSFRQCRSALHRSADTRMGGCGRL